jgi:hypothetical protein
VLSHSLAAAFEDDPIFGWLRPDAGRRYERLARFFALEVGDVVLPSGTAWISRDGGSACLELPRGGWRLPLRTQARHAPGFERVFGRSLPRALVMITKMDRRHPGTALLRPHVGVGSQTQGASLGPGSSREPVARADAEGLPTYLEATSERNAALYERLGFEHLGAFTVLGSPPLWPMRLPRPESS